MNGILISMCITGKEIKKKWPKWAVENKIEDKDIIFLAGNKVKILKSYD